MSLTIAAGLSAAKELDSTVGIIRKYVQRLVQDKTGAGVRLSAALGLVRASCDAFDRAITSYLALGLSEEPLIQGATILLQVQGGRLAADVGQGIGGCHKIKQIYDQDLDRWFTRVFRSDSPEVRELREAFENLSNADATMFEGMRNAAYSLQASADEALNLVLAGNAEVARERIRAQLPELLPLRKWINDVLKMIEEINGEIICAGVG